MSISVLRRRGSDSQVGLPDGIGLLQLGAGALHDDLSRLQHVGAIGDLQGLHDVLLHQQDAHALLVERLQDAKQLLDQERREPQRRLVQDQELRFRHQRGRDPHSPPPPPSARPPPRRAAPLNAGKRNRPPPPPPPFLGARAAAQSRAPEFLLPPCP